MSDHQNKFPIGPYRHEVAECLHRLAESSAGHEAESLYILSEYVSGHMPWSEREAIMCAILDAGGRFCRKELASKR